MEDLGEKVAQLTTIIQVLMAVILGLSMVLLAQMDCDPKCAHCEAKRNADKNAWVERYYGSAYCKQHAKPKHECRDEHR